MSRPARPAPLPPRVFLLLPAGLALLAGLDAALMLLGLPAPVRAQRLPEVHGMLMVLGFLGTVIALERAVALRRAWGYAAPALLGAGAVLVVSPAPLTVGRFALLAGAAALVAVYVPLWQRQADDAVLVQALGAVLALGAAVLWLGGVPVADLLPWLVGFVVLTIGGERLELARVAMGAAAGAALVALAGAVGAAAVVALLAPQAGSALFGVTLLALVAWLVRHDVARRTVHGSGAARYMAWCMLAGYGWLAAAGLVWAVSGRVDDGPGYDVVVHAVFLGFAMSMVLAHASSILPAVLRRPLPYRPAMYVPALVLQVSLAVRLWLGDALDLAHAWRLGAVLNIVALLLFVSAAALGLARAPRAAARRTARPVGSRPAGSPSAGSPPAGPPSAGSPSAGSPPAGPPSAGSPSAGPPPTASPWRRPQPVGPEATR